MKLSYSYLLLLGSAILPTALVQAENQPDNATELDTVQVVGEQQPYFEKSNRTALKMESDDLKTPFSTTIINSVILEDLKANTLEDAYAYVPGFSRSGTGANSFTIRGHSADLQNIQVDGLPGLASRFGSPVTANIERVEILKGPASVLYGWMDPAGLVNIVTKKPQAEQNTSVDVTVQRYTDQGQNGIEGSIDSTGALNADGSVLYRLIAGAEASDSFRDDVDTDTQYLYPSVSWLPDAQSRLDIQLEYTKQNRSADNGLFTINNDIDSVADIETYYQEKGDFDNDEGYGVAIAYRNDISDSLATNIKWRSIWHEDERDLYENNKVNDAEQTLTRRNRHQYNERQYHFLDANLEYQFGSVIQHQVLVGLNGGYEYRQYDRLAFDTKGAEVSLQNPNYTGAALEDDPGSFRQWDLNTVGVYALDRMAINEQWTVLLGARYDQQSGDYEESFKDKDDERSENETVSDSTYNAGVVYSITPEVSVYTSYAESFNPQAIPSFDVNGDQLDPETGEQWEAGIKFGRHDGRLNMNLAYFDVVKGNIAEEGSSGEDELIGEISSEGVELNLQAQPTDTLQFQLGYTYTDAEISKAEEKRDDTLGNPPGFAPQNTASLISRYNHPQLVLGGLVGASIGWKYEDKRFTDEESKKRVELPSYNVLDMAFYYEVENAKYALNIDNVGNTEFFNGGSNDTRIYPGDPRKVSLSARFYF
ncbi:TonB-dependent siderophore receptor [Bacterioplanoides sp. SCSIO 12839]|uniref:TonB-dependent siderophore receptor n=1 Tax=Bacterioplanoides sp. SCSIO 12839 TaxID=2829569 RepID=UPI002104C13F|nr:TonB-dependent receptor [Bacterioplanoides sp. SCSIO 12839]UTW49341.1 TonB-dependent receptor [Bacterioplanoides sp. SCSIO 12839]